MITQLSLLANPSLVIPNRLTFSVYPLDRRNTLPLCPTEFSVTEIARSYEGGYTVEGSASLDWFARPFKIEKSDEFSVTWMAKLQIKYHNCQASAKITKINDKPFNGHSYLRMRFINDSAYLILDMTGMNDANKFTSVIINKNVKDGNPIWSWSGSD